MNRPGVSAVVLAGGESSRLGGDKAMAELGGYSLLGRVAAAARASADEVVIVTGDRQAHAKALAAVGLPAEAVLWTEDLREAAGPLAGIEAGLAAAEHETCLLLACDLPFLRPAPLRALLTRFEEWGPEDVGRPRLLLPVGGGEPQPLCSVCDRAAGGVASACLEEGERAVGAWLDRLALREVDVGELPGAETDERTAWWTDVDDPEELERARAAAGSPGLAAASGGDADPVTDDRPHPAPRLETERLVLDAAGPRFARELFESYGRDPEVTRYLLWEPHASIDETIDFLRDSVRSWREGDAFVWGIRERAEGGEPGPLVGMIGLRPGSEHDQVGYALTRDRWGRGYMTEALARVLEEATGPMGMERVGITVHPDNEGSIRVLEKAGLTREGTVDDHHVFPNLGDEPHACYVYGYRPSTPPVGESP